MRQHGEPALAVACALAGAVMVAWGTGRFPALDGDEGIYVGQAWSLAHGRLTPYTYTYDHPFLGWLQLAPLLEGALALHVGGTLSVQAGRAVMVAYAFATLLLTYGIARRLRIRAPFAGAAVLVLGLSPLFLIEARQVFLDNIAVPWLLASCWLVLTPRRRLGAYVLAGFAMAVGVLSKETLALLVPVPIYLLWTRAYRPTRSMGLALFLAVTALLVLAHPLFAALRGELLPGPGHVSLWTNGIVYQLASRKGSGPLWDPASGRHALLERWLGSDPLLLLAGVVAAAACVAVPRLRPLSLGVLLWALPVIKPGGYLPAMYVIAVLPFCALAVAGFADAATAGLARLLLAAVRRLRRAAPRVVAVAAAGTAAVLAAAAAIAYLPADRGITFLPRSTVAVSATAERYVEAHARRGENVVVDNAFWTDLVRDGFGGPWHGAISYYQFDLDPIGSKKNLPEGWQDIDYVIETSAMQQNLSGLHLERLAEVFAHSRVVASWGSGGEQVRIRAVDATRYNGGEKETR